MRTAIEIDPRELPRFSVREAAMALGVSPSTLRAWVRGRTYQTRHEVRVSSPVVKPAAADAGDHLTLSFYNLAEIHVLSALRVDHRIKLPRIRAAVQWLREAYPGQHPLLSHDFFSNGVDLFVKKLVGRQLRSINASRGGQFGLDQVLNQYLKRLDRDAEGKLRKIFPAVPGALAPRIISMTYDISAGRPVVDGAGVRASVVWNRHQAGDSVKELAADYGLREDQIQAALDYFSHASRLAA